MITQSCSSCRFFNRWAISIGHIEDGTDNSVCRKHVWEFTREMTDEEMLAHIDAGATCPEYKKRGGN